MSFLNAHPKDFEDHFLFFADVVVDFSYSGAGDFGDVEKSSFVVFVEVSVGAVLPYAHYSGHYEISRFGPF